MTTLVTGGNGWVPSFIVRQLARSGERVISYDLMEPDAPLAELLGEDMASVTFVAGDVTDRERMKAVAAEHDVDAVIHAAVITPRVDREREEPARIIDVNIGGTVAALETARERPGLRRFVYISSASVGGENPGLPALTEESPANATSLYGVTKLASERIVLRYGELFGMDVVAVRPSNVYGPMERVTPGYRGATELREMLRLHAAGEPVLVDDLTGNARDWTYVEDIARAVELVWAAPELPHQVYNITCGQRYSVGEVLELWSQLMPGFRFQEVPLERANYPVDIEPLNPTPSGARLRTDLGWEPPTSLAEGMREYLRWIRRHGPQ